MITFDRDMFYLVCLLFGAFWVIVEGLIAFWVWKMYKMMKVKLEK